jgi:tetratricopeptide (TPR) repeat protein
MDDLNRALKIKPDSYEAYKFKAITKFAIGDLKGALGDNRHAIVAYSKLIKRNPKNYWTYQNRGIARKEMGDYKGAIEDFNIMIDKYPDSVVAYYMRGLAKMKSGDKESACDDLNRTLNLGYQEKGVAFAIFG